MSAPAVNRQEAPEFDQPYGNGAAVADLSSGSSGDPGLASAAAPMGEVAMRARQQLADHERAVAGVSATLSQLPEAVRPRAASLCQQTALTARMLAEDLATLDATDPEESGALTEEVEALLAELVDGTLLVDAYRMLGEETQRLRLLSLSPALVGLFGPPVVVAPALGEYNTLLHQALEARERFRTAIREAGEAAIQMAAQQGVSFLLEGVAVAVPGSAPALVFVDVFVGNQIDDALGSPRSSLALELANQANTLSGQLDKAKAVGDALNLGECLLSDQTLDRIGLAVDLVDALAEMGDAGLQAAEAFQEMQDLAPQVEAARAALGDTLARIEEILSPIVLGLLQSVADATHDVASAVDLVDQTEAELGALF